MIPHLMISNVILALVTLFEMGGHHEAPYKIPDYKVFKVEGHPQLEELERALAAKGLKDPWIRNEVWRHNPGFGNPRQRALTFFFRGLGVGVVLTGLTIAYDKITGSGSHGHGDHGDHH